MEPTVKWPAENTAFLLIHGGGSHREYETLDKFVCKFYQLLQNFVADLDDAEHNLDCKGRSYVRFKRTRPGYPHIDLYEYYWDRYMVRNIRRKQLTDWLKKLEDGIIELRTDKSINILDKNYRLPLLLAERDWLGWLRNRILKCIFTQAQERLRLIRRYSKADCLKRLDEFFSKWSVDLLTDVVIYCLKDQRSSYYEIKENMLSGAVDELTGLLNSDPKYKQIIIVGHSLGSVIAYDALNRIAKDFSNPIHPPDAKRDLEDKGLRLKGLVTFGSFLDVVACFFQEHVLSENKLERWIKVERHAFRKPAAGAEYANPIDYRILNNVKWLNFWHPDDVVADRPLFSYELGEDDQIQCSYNYKKELKWWERLLDKIPVIGTALEWAKALDAHGSYWKDEKMYQKIAETFLF